MRLLNKMLAVDAAANDADVVGIASVVGDFRYFDSAAGGDDAAIVKKKIRYKMNYA